MRTKKARKPVKEACVSRAQHEAHADSSSVIIGVGYVIQINFIGNANSSHAPRSRIDSVVDSAAAAAGGADSIRSGLGPAAISVVFDSAFCSSEDQAMRARKTGSPAPCAAASREGGANR